ncbi:TetR/AcrR family transcriptional regulator [Aquimarina sp. D1M17]|uniref:TetR/AcrR family transcriptional regulator n=1 Tax=Aquimarina acroporae TaxID=2937283 RepID=UPI0020BF91BC|nr:TetR/AcrR family transcriptional regulator [Aquimarina acroporae]MCK8524222.1 TetR/AcrR family transcriptional regulator [Aquimarina acroporae]
MDRKQEIIEQSVTLFNKKGFFNVSIKDISQTMGISPGNFTYYFKKKENLLAAIQEEVLDNAIEIMPENQYITLFHFEEMFKKFYLIQSKYRFFFLDILYLIEEYPVILEGYKKATLKRFEDARSLVSYFIASDRLVPEGNRVDYKVMIKALWMTSTFWSAGVTIIDQKNTSNRTEDSPLTSLWGILLPYLTDKGYQEYVEITKSSLSKTN